jgi:hypothetical protein
MKRLTLVLALAFALVAGNAFAAANPFSDVPFSHWAYDAVQKLASKGILQGYPDGTFKGEKAVTLYALAMVTAKMLATVEQMMEKGFGEHLVTKSDLQTLEKLTVEFADELALLGVKVTALEDDMQVVKEDVSMLKKDVEGIKDYMAKGGMEKVKLSGDMLVRHSSLITNRDHSNTGLGTNVDNVQTQTQLRFKFTANIDENIQAVARWRMFSKTDQRANFIGVTDAQRWGYAGAGTLHRGYDTFAAEGAVMADLAYLHIKHMFRFGGDFTFGRNFYTEGHGLVLSDYVDAIKYYKRSGDVDVTFYTIYDCHRGSWKDDVPGVNFKNIWALALDYKWRDHDLYMNIYGQDDSASLRRNYADPTAGLAANDSLITAAQIAAAATAKLYKEDARWDVEFGSKGPIGKNGHWDYDLGFAYTNYEVNMVTGPTVSVRNAAAADTLNNNWSNINLDGWLGHVGVKWDSKKEWAAKLGYTFGTDEAVGAYAIDNDRRYDNGFETPYEDISRGNNYFRAGLLNMYDLKLQVEYRPRDTRHYFRLAGDFLDELKDTVSNDAARVAASRHFPGITDSPATFIKTNSIYDRWNNFGTADANATVLTFEYRYQLAENTRIRIGYTAFEMTGDYRKAGYAINGSGIAAAFNATIPAQSAGRNASLANGDYDYNYFWAELYSQF